MDMTDETTRFSERLQARAAELGYPTPKELHRAMLIERYDVTIWTVQRWWDGANLPSGSLLLALCVTLDCTPNDLLLD
jgi:hypothetical protein